MVGIYEILRAVIEYRFPSRRHMKSVCVILLDTSSSMAGGFEGEQQKHGSHYVEADTKIEAAKKWLLAELDGLPNTEIVLIAFDAEARLVLRTSSADTQPMKELLPGIEARGAATNIAAALYMAAEAHQSSKAHFKTVLLISDGLSNSGDPVAAADEARRRGIQINTVLIDPTSEGQFLADQISRGGTVWAAASGAQMRRAIHEGARPPLASNLVPIIAAIVSIIGIIGTLSTVLSAGLDKPGLAEFVAAAALLCFFPLLIYVWATREIGTAIYTSSTEFYTPKYFRYGSHLRQAAATTMIVCLSSSALLFYTGSKMRQVLQLRVVNYSEYILNPVKVVLPALDDSFDLTVKPQQTTTYHTASMKFTTCVRLLLGHPRARGSVEVSATGTATEPNGQTITRENLIPTTGKYSLVVETVFPSSGIKKALALTLNRE